MNHVEKMLNREREKTDQKWLELMDSIKDMISDEFSPEEIFGWDRMEKWAENNGFVKGPEWQAETKMLCDKVD